MIIVKIDVMKIDKSKLFSGKNGAKYLDIVLMENRDGEDQYGNSHMSVQGVTKEERANGVKGAILGNGKTIGGTSRSQERPSSGTRPAPSSSLPDLPEDDIPF